MEATLHNRLETAKALNNVRLRLRDDAHCAGERDHDKNDDGNHHDDGDVADDVT